MEDSMTTETTTAPAAVDAVTTTDAAGTVAAAADAVQTAAPVAIQHGASVAEAFNGIGANVVYLMGFSFILGSLFTVLILVILDYMRRHKQ
jgi:hypothetical protein